MPDPQHLAGHPTFHQLTAHLSELHSKKNADYTKGTAVLGNFDRVSKWMKLYPDMDWSTPIGVALVYAAKQTDAALMALSHPSVKANFEGVAERLTDDAVYKLIAICIQSDEWTFKHNERVRQANADMGSRTAGERG